MNTRHLATPWAPGAAAYSLPGSMILKLRLGEAPKHVPSHIDVTTRSAAPASTLDGGVIDRLVRHHVQDARITRVHSARASLGKRGQRHVGFDDQEENCGMSRTFRLQVKRGSPIESLTHALNEVGIVEFAMPNYLCSVPFAAVMDPPAPINDEQAWTCRDLMFANEALAYEPGDASVIVGLVDSGVAPHHPETIGRFRAGYDTVQLGSGDFATGVTLLGDETHIDNKPVDEYVGHGMGCAGIISARGENIPPGLAGDCRLLPVRVLGAAKLANRPVPIGLGALSDIDCGMKMAVELGARLINMSFGTADSALDPLSPKPHADVVRYALMRGCILVAASGNSGKNEILWPAAHDGVISVGSAAANGLPSSFSTRGAHVALCAIGERVATCGLTGYQLATGTSFAAPFVTAAAALLVSRASRRSYPLNAREVRHLLMESASPWSKAKREFEGCGSGILNAAAALRALDREINGSPAAEGEPDAPDVTDE